MKVVILAGGFGTRIAEESAIRPKPLVEIGGRPILWHIMKIYSRYGLNDFIICCGYKGNLIKQYFKNYAFDLCDLSLDLYSGRTEILRNGIEPWKVTMIDTGENTMTGGRIKRIARYLDPDEPFCLTYGDGVTDLNIADVIDFHKSHGKLATVTAVHQPGRFGALGIASSDTGPMVQAFREKRNEDGSYINGGYFVLQPEVIDYIDGDDTVWEQEPLKKLAAENQLIAYRHDGFWQNMDTLRDRNLLEAMWSKQEAPWKAW